MKPLAIVAAFVALLASTLAAASQDPWSTMLAGFDIAVAHTAKGASLRCGKGCSWKTLEFTVTSESTPINEFGMVDDKAGNPGTRGHFLIRIATDKEAFQLSCDRGCAWRTLGWIFPTNGTGVRITEYGMTRNK